MTNHSYRFALYCTKSEKGNQNTDRLVINYMYFFKPKDIRPHNLFNFSLKRGIEF